MKTSLLLALSILAPLEAALAQSVAHDVSESITVPAAPDSTTYVLQCTNPFLRGKEARLLTVTVKNTQSKENLAIKEITYQDFTLSADGKSYLPSYSAKMVSILESNAEGTYPLISTGTSVGGGWVRAMVTYEHTNYTRDIVFNGPVARGRYGWLQEFKAVREDEGKVNYDITVWNCWIPNPTQSEKL